VSIANVVLDRFRLRSKEEQKGDRQFGKAAKSAAEPYYLYRGEYSQKIVKNPYND
jgi:hypothetical protein